MEQIEKTQLGLDDTIRKTLKSKIKLNSVGYARSTKTKYRTDLMMNFCDDDFSYLSDKVVKIIGDYAKKIYIHQIVGVLSIIKMKNQHHTQIPKALGVGFII